MITDSDAHIKALVATINSSCKTRFRWLGKMERGVNGAYLIESPGGIKHILKLVSPLDITAQISRSARCADTVRGPQTPTPRYEMVDFTKGFGSWYIQEFLPGIDAPVPSLKLVTQIMAMNDRQAGAAVDGHVNWSQKVQTSLHHDTQGWQHRIASSGKPGQELVERVRKVYVRQAAFAGHAADIVHGDCQHYNALMDGTSEVLTGYVDWEGAGCGDRSIDLARLLYDVYVALPECNYPPEQETIDLLRNRIEALTGRAGLNVYMSYWVLQVADFGVKCGPADAAKFFDVSRRILDELER